MDKEKLKNIKSYLEELKTTKMKQTSPSNFLSIESYSCTLKNNKTITREKILKGNNDGSAAIILPITEDKKIILAIEPRVFTKETVDIGLPAGYIESFENPIDAAKRELLEETGYIDDKDAFLKDIFFRESQGCTGIGNGIAIPHGKSPSVTKVGIAIAKLTNEIEWETLDGKGVKVILLFAVGDKTEDAQEHLKLLAQVAGKLGNDEIVEKLLKAESVEEIKSVFL